MAEALAHKGLQIAGVTIDKNGAVIFPSYLMVKDLDSHFGVLTVGTGSVMYHLKPLHEIEELHESKSDPFAVDAMRAVDLVRKGSSIAIVVCAIVDGDSFTRLYVYSCKYQSKPMYEEEIYKYSPTSLSIPMYEEKM